MYGCVGPAQEPAWEIDGFEFYVCPMRFITSNLLDFILMIRYDKEFGTGEKYLDQMPKYIEAWDIYNSYYNRFTGERMRSNKPDDLREMGRNFIKMKRDYGD